ncbi:hypothetical protein [Neobacillus drentensis]|uniref:hypothetical protein n=1 Tax=Neobacillus drentensis TaxID=220684 RepID=UPI0030030497
MEKVLKLIAMIFLLFSLAACTQDEEVSSKPISGDEILKKLIGEWHQTKGKDATCDINVNGNIITIDFDRSGQQESIMLLRFNFINDHEVNATITEGPDENNVGHKVVLHLFEDYKSMNFMDLKDDKVVHKTIFTRKG